MVDDARKMAAEIAELKEAVRALQTSVRIGYTAIDGGALLVKDETGAVRQRIGRQTDGAYTVVDRNGITPPQPAAPVLLTGPITVTIASYGNTANGSEWPHDLAAIEAHASTSSGFTPSTATKVAEFTTGGGSHNVRGEPDVPLYVVLVGRNTSGTLGPASDEVSATPEAAVSAAQLAAIDAAIEGLDSRVTTNEDGVTTAEAAATGLQYEVTLAQTGVDDLDVRVTTAEATITQHESDIEDITTVQLPGKNRVIYSTSQPGSNSNTAGDTWYVFLAGEVVEVWQGLGGTDWTQLTIGGATVTNLDAGTITTGVLAAARIATASITAGKLAAAAVEAGNLAADAVVAGNVAAGAIVAGNLAANAVVAGNVAAGAITTASLAADAITGMTITGGLFRTAETGSRIVIAPDISPSGRDAIQIYADHPLQSQPAQLTVEEYGGGTTIEGNFLSITAGEWTDQTHTTPQITLKTERRNDGAGNPTEFRSTNSHYAALHYFEGDVELWGDVTVNGDLIEDTDWITPTLLNGWSNYGGAYTGARYRRKNGIVYVQGLVKNGGGVIFVLPAGFRPSAQLLFSGIEGTNTVCRTDVEPNGNVSGAAGASNAFWSINLSFPADQ